MSSTSGLARQQVSFSSADVVQGQITSIDNQISGLNGDLRSIGNAIQNLVAELQALRPPQAPGSSSDSALAAYQNALSTYQNQVNAIKRQIDTLNDQSQQISQKINELQNKVQQMQASDLPSAQRQDAQRQENELKQMQDTYEATAKAAGASSSVSESERAGKAELKRQQLRVGADSVIAPSDGSLQLRVSWKNLQVNDSSDLKTLVRAFQLHLSMVGDGTDIARRSNSAVAMPYTPGTGLPPVGTP